MMIDQDLGFLRVGDTESFVFMARYRSGAQRHQARTIDSATYHIYEEDTRYDGVAEAGSGATTIVDSTLDQDDDWWNNRPVVLRQVDPDTLDEATYETEVTDFAAGSLTIREIDGVVPAADDAFVILGQPVKGEAAVDDLTDATFTVKATPDDATAKPGRYVFAVHLAFGDDTIEAQLRLEVRRS